MLVFNNEVFKQHSSRPGSSVDVLNIIKTFTKLGFDVQCHENQTKGQMMNTLKKGRSLTINVRPKNCSNYPKIRTKWFDHKIMCPKDADKMANRVEPYLTAFGADLGQ